MILGHKVACGLAGALRLVQARPPVVIGYGCLAGHLAVLHAHLEREFRHGRAEGVEGLGPCEMRAVAQDGQDRATEVAQVGGADMQGAAGGEQAREEPTAGTHELVAAAPRMGVIHNIHALDVGQALQVRRKAQVKAAVVGRVHLGLYGGVAVQHLNLAYDVLALHVVVPESKRDAAALHEVEHVDCVDRGEGQLLDVGAAPCLHVLPARAEKGLLGVHDARDDVEQLAGSLGEVAG